MADLSDIRTVNSNDAAHLEHVGEFIQLLLQAFLRTGYYMPDHPETRKAKAGLYDKFARSVGTRGEITLLIDEEQGRKILLIEGIDDKPLKLSNIMQRGVAETYTTHFIKFLERKEIVCLSLNARMEMEEFSRFIDIMSEPGQAASEGATAKEQFVRSLQQRQIYNISFVFVEDFIADRPHLPWRTRMALSRLKKDIHLLPILRNLSNDEMNAVKLQILADILRPLGIAELMYSLLLNLDLAASPFFSEEEGEKEVFTLINDSLLNVVGNLFIRDALAERGGFPQHITPQKRARVLAGLSQRLCLSQNPHAAALLETLFNKELIALEALPPVIKNHVVAIKRLTTFLLKPDAFLQSFDKATKPDAYDLLATTMASFVPLLVKRGEFNEAIAIVTLFNTHAEEQSERASLALQKRSEIIFGETLGHASEKFLTASKETRTLIGHLFRLIGYGAILPLQRILTASDDPWRSKQAAEILISMGGQAVECLFSVVEEMRIDPASLPAIIRLISDLSQSVPREHPHLIMLLFVDDTNVETRREALAGLSRINPADHLSIFKDKLADPDLKIRKIAVTALGRGGDRRAVELLTAVIEAADKTGEYDEVEIVGAAIEALGTLAVHCPPAHDTILQYLTSLTSRFCDSRSWKKLFSGEPTRPDSLVLSLAETLGRLEGATIRELLKKLAHHHSPAVAQRAEELLISLCN